MGDRKVWTCALTFVAALALGCFVLLNLWGAIDVIRLGWCASSWTECSVMMDVPLHAGACAVLAGLASLPTLVMFRSRLSPLPATKLLSLALVCSVLLLLVYPATLEVRSAIASRYFPYVTVIRFGATGFFMVWTALSLVVISLAVSAALPWLQKVRPDG